MIFIEIQLFFVLRNKNALSPNSKNRCRNGKNVLSKLSSSRVLFAVLSSSFSPCTFAQIADYSVFVYKVERVFMLCCLWRAGPAARYRSWKMRQVCFDAPIQGGFKFQTPDDLRGGLPGFKHRTRPGQPTAVRNFGNSWVESHSVVQHS